MFESLKTLWKKEQTPLQDYDQQSRQLAEKLPGWRANYSASLAIARCKKH